MPMLDMPIEQLKQYKGTNPCPEDMESYWEKALNEIRASDNDVELKPADFQVPFADCYDMYYTGRGGDRVYAKLLKPKYFNGKRPAILMFHGYMGYSGEWAEKLPYVAAGFIVASMDCRGQGGRSEDKIGRKGTTMYGQLIRGIDGEPDGLLMRDIFLDTVKLAEIVMRMPDVDENRVGTTGTSQGGGLAIACAALEPRIKKTAVACPFLSDYLRVWDMDLDLGAYEELRSFFKWFDPLHERQEEIFRKLGYIDVHNLASRVRAETLIAITMQDTTCPPSTQFAVYNCVTAKKNALIYYDFDHGDWMPGWNDRKYQFLLELAQ